MNALKEWFNNLSPKGKKSVIYLVIAGAIVAFALGSYKPKEKAKTDPFKKVEAVELDRDLLQKTELSESRRKIDILQKQIEKLQIGHKYLLYLYGNIKANDSVKKESAKTPEGLPRIPTSSEIEQQKTSSFKNLPPPPVPLTPEASANRMRAQERNKKTIGGIAVMSNPVKPEDQKKKNERSVYLPPSFMSAVLLTGLDAATSNSGKSNPDPVLLRVQTPAVLPNDVKANLSGCFVVGEGQGRLDKERVDVRLISLSCLSNEGRAVIDAKIKGFVTDADAKTGLAGHVVSRMGASTARALIAGLFTGAGEALKVQSTTVSTSSQGSVSTIDPSKVGSYALGSGLSAGAQNLSNFYLTLARQTTPVIEANADKHVTVVISEGVQLAIRDLPPQDEDLKNEDYY